jgi:hypothetical protein
LHFFINEKIEVLPLSQVTYAAENGFLKPETLYFNNLVQTKKELENNWIIPVKDSWLLLNFKPWLSNRSTKIFLKSAILSLHQCIVFIFALYLCNYV